LKTKKTNNILIKEFISAAERFSDCPALEIKDISYSYEELYIFSNKIASCILSRSTENNSMVAVLAAKSFVAYSGILGALMASKAYVPLNPRFPLLRCLNMFLTSEADTIIAEINKSVIVILPDTFEAEDLKIKFPQHIFISGNELTFEENINVKTYPESIAYLLFTSGSTGQPKGVPVSNGNVTSYLNYILKKYDFVESDRFSQTFDLTFDLSVHDLFVCWLSGACLCVPDEDSFFSMSKYIKKKNITVWFSVPSHAVLMSKMRLLKNKTFPDLRYSFFCGEPLLSRTAEAWQTTAPNSQIINLYGPTETTIAISFYEWKKNDKNDELNGIVSIGKIFPTQDFCIINSKCEIVKPGTKGELCLSGSQVIDGYFKDEVNTSKHFIKISKKGNKIWYKTGDIVIEAGNKNIYFTGRTDSEVKISGYRVNLFEVDHTIAKVVDTESVVTIYAGQEKNASNKLFSFIGILANNKINEKTVLNYCKEHLPWYMIPEKIFFINKLPLNVNGKINRKRLIEKYL
jgi:amino acid adenylation domain-containing protein